MKRSVSTSQTEDLYLSSAKNLKSTNANGNKKSRVESNIQDTTYAIVVSDKTLNMWGSVVLALSEKYSKAPIFNYEETVAETLEVLPGWLRIGTNEWIVTTADLEPVPWSLTYNIQQSTIQGYVECSLLLNKDLEDKQNVHEKNEKNKTMSTFNNTNHNNNRIFKHGRLWCSSSFNTFIPSSIPAQVLALRMYEPIAVLSRTERISIPNASKLKIVQIALPQSKLIAATAFRINTTT